MSIKSMTGFTHVHLPLVSDYSQVLSAPQDSLVSVYRSSVITRKYKSAQQELLVSIFSLSAIAHEQYTSHVAWAQQANYLQIFSRHKALLAFFCKLGRELYCMYVASYISKNLEISTVYQYVFMFMWPVRYPRSVHVF